MEDLAAPLPGGLPVLWERLDQEPLECPPGSPQCSRSLKGMDEELQDLFRAKGLSEEHLELIMATDPALCSVGDLASGAVSETDARSWADEMGLDGRVLKSRFIQSWLQARNVFHRMLEDAYSPLPSGSSTPQAWSPQAWTPEAGGTMSPGGKLLIKRGGYDGLKDEEVLNEKSILVNHEAFMASCGSHNSSPLDTFDRAGFDFSRRVPVEGTLSGSTSPTRSSIVQMPLLFMEADPDLPSKSWQDSPGRQSIETEMDLPRTAQSPPGQPSSEELMARSTHKGNSSGRVTPPEFSMRRPWSTSLAEELQATIWERMDPDFPARGATNPPVQLQLTERMMAALEEAHGSLRSQRAEMVPVLSKGYPQDSDTSSGSDDSERSEDELRRRIMPAGVEECATEGGLSTPLLRILKQSRLTSSEIKLLEEKIGPRTVKEVVSFWSNEGEVMRAGKDAGLTSKVSIGYFVQAWHECIATVAATKKPLSTIKERGSWRPILKEGPNEYPLSAMCFRGDYAAACNLLMQRLGKRKKTDLIPLLKGLLGYISSTVYQSTPDGKKVQVTSRKVLPIVASAYGRDVANRVGRKAEVEEAEARWTWTVRKLFSIRMSIALQKDVLKAYRSESFEASCRELRARWRSAEARPMLDDKTAETEALCLEKVLRHVLPAYGFPPTQEGVEEMRATVRQHSITNSQVRRLRTEVMRAVLDNLPM